MLRNKPRAFRNRGEINILQCNKTYFGLRGMPRFMRLSLLSYQKARWLTAGGDFLLSRRKNFVEIDCLFAFR